MSPLLFSQDAVLLSNNVAITLGENVVAAYYSTESLELMVKTALSTIVLGGGVGLSAEQIEEIIKPRGKYRIAGKYPDYSGN